MPGTLTSSGYGGFVADEATWSSLAPHLGTEYGCADDASWNVTKVTGSDRTVSVAAGPGWGKGINDSSPAPVQLTLTSVGSGLRWDLIVAHRDTSGSGGTTTFDVVEGTSDPNAVFALRDVFGPSSTTDDQPLALARVDAGSALITDLIDVRVWQANGGAVAKNTYPLQYLTKLGTQILIGTDLYTRTFDTSGTVTWLKTPLVPAVPPLTVLGAGPAQSMLPLNVVPSLSSGFKIQAGSFVGVSDAAGYTRLTFPTAFPNGLLSCVIMNGDGAADQDVTFGVAGSADWGFGTRSDIVYRIWGSNGPRQVLPGAGHRINWIAVGW